MTVLYVFLFLKSKDGLGYGSLGKPLLVYELTHFSSDGVAHFRIDANSYSIKIQKTTAI